MASIIVHDLDDNLLPDSIFAYRTVAIDRLAEIQKEADLILDGPDISDNETFRSYIANKSYTIPESFPEAKSIIIMAVFTPMALVDFHYDGSTKQVIIPPQYYSMLLTEEILESTIHQKIIGDPGFKLENANRIISLKRLAVQSGLARYGRNNIIYVEGMGSFLTLYAYFTDYEFDENTWTEVKLMDACLKCKACMHNCPTGAIRSESFVIDAGRCLTLYNEIAGDFPDWLPRSAHNALMGCMRCQSVCPANKKVMKKPVYLHEITSNETSAILSGNIDETLLNTMKQKLNDFDPTASLKTSPIFTRNLRAIFEE